MHDEPGPSGPNRTVSLVLLGLLGLAVVAGLALAGWLSWEAVPKTGLFGTARTPAIQDGSTALTEQIYDLYSIVFWIAAVVFVGVQLAILAPLVLFRRKPDNLDPPQWHGNNLLEVTWTIIPAVVVIGVGWYSFAAMRANYASAPSDADSVVITATGQQWWWAFDYREPAFTTTTELVVPVGQPVKVYLESVDVLHAFWVPELAAKFDAVPGQRDGGYGQNLVWFTATKPGRYEGQCAELCGTQHAGMRFTVIAVEPAQYQAWAAAMAETPPIPAEDPDSAEWRGYQAVSNTCQACHAIDGVDTMVGTIGPNLTRVATRSFLAGGVIPHTPEDMAAWIDQPESRKVGSKMQAMGLQADGIADVMAYFQSMALDPEIMRPILAAEPRPAVIPPAYVGLVEPLDARDFPPMGSAGDHHDEAGEHEDDEHEDEDAGDHDADDSEAARPGEAAPRLESRR